MNFFGMQIGRQVRQESPNAGSDQRKAPALVDVNTAIRTAAVEFGLNVLVRAMASASVEPRHPAVTPAFLGDVILDLMLKGWHCSYIDNSEEGNQRLLRAAARTITGDVRQNTWRFNLSLNGPTGVLNRIVGNEEVVYIPFAPDSINPWLGRSPLQSSQLTAETLALTEDSLRQEMRAVVAKLVIHPPGMLGTVAQNTAAAQHAANAQGRAIWQAGGASPYGQRAVPSGDWKQIALGPMPDANVLALRNSVAQDVLSAMGIPAGLLAPREGSVSRESYRQFLVGTVQPYANLIADELSRKLGRVFRIRFHGMAAMDILVRARAYAMLKDGGMSEEEARTISGIDG